MNTDDPDVCRGPKGVHEWRYATPGYPCRWCGHTPTTVQIAKLAQRVETLASALLDLEAAMEILTAKVYGDKP